MSKAGTTVTNSTPWRNIVPQELVIDASVVSSIAAKSLFYPCSGGDWKSTVPLFLPHVQDFWFVDTCYRPKPTGYLRIPGRWGLRPIEEPTVEGVDLPKEDIESDRKYRGCNPFIQRERFWHEPSGNEITIQWVMRRGPSALRALAAPIGIFLYRGDSDDGGSGTRWLLGRRNCGQLFDVLHRLVPGGLIITDGSNEWRPGGNPYRALAAFVGQYDLPPAEAAEAANSFTKDGRSFECVGYVNVDPRRYKGPILIWQVK